MTARVSYIKTCLVLTGLLFLSGQSCPADGDPMLPADPAPQPTSGTPSPSDQSAQNDPVVAGDGLVDEDGKLFLDIDFTDGIYWKMGGNGGTDATQHFLGTLDEQAFELRVGGLRALSLEPNDECPNLVAGFEGNGIAEGVVGAAINGGGLSDPDDATTMNFVWDNYGTIGGGAGNVVGTQDADPLEQAHATVAGGFNNTASGKRAFIGGGQGNVADGNDATVSGGRENLASSFEAVVSGGWQNTASEARATVSGGYKNAANAAYATVSGGQNNVASGTRSNVGGGSSNLASGSRAIVSGGSSNTASGAWATIGGGDQNTAFGEKSTVPGGDNNFAGGDRSFAAGSSATVDEDHSGTFLYADFATPLPFHSVASNEFAVRATGGVRFVSGLNGSSPNSGVILNPGSGSWSGLSDRNVKENFEQVDEQEILRRLAEIPIETWNYKTQDGAIRHIGPMAQDFYAAFSMGADETRITNVDADGVALAAIKGLHTAAKERDAVITAQEDRIEAQQERIHELEQRLLAIEAQLR